MKINIKYREVNDDIETSEFFDISDELTIGKSPDCDLQLDSPFISSMHAKLTLVDDLLFIKDLGSKNGIIANNSKIDAEMEIISRHPEIQIGNFLLNIEFGDINVNSENVSTSPIDLVDDQEEQENNTNELATRLRKKIHAKLLKILKVKQNELIDTEDPKIQSLIKENLSELIEEYKNQNSDETDFEKLEKEILEFIIGFGPLEDLLNDESITEIMVNGPNEIFVERSGKLVLSKQRFNSKSDITQIIEKILSPLGKSVNESNPIADARLLSGKAKGSRINVIIPPISLKSPTLTIRKFSEDNLTPEDLISFNSINSNMVNFLKIAVFYRKNIIIAGGTGSGKTTLLNILSSFIPENDRIITVEDAAELQLSHDHLVSLETRVANIEGKGEVTIRDLVINTLRMRPDRIIVGECRGGEALDMLQAMNTGHDGSLTTVHANSPRDVLSRLETMVLMSGLELPIPAIRAQIASAINFVVQQSRFPDGSRKVTHITEVTGMQNDIISSQNIFEFVPKSVATKRIEGDYNATGIVPKFVHELKSSGVDIDMGIFKT